MFRVLFCSFSYSCVKWVQSSILISLLWKRESVVQVFFHLWPVTGCQCLFVNPLGVIDRLCSVMVALNGHFLNYF